MHKLGDRGRMLLRLLRYPSLDFGGPRLCAIFPLPRKRARPLSPEAPRLQSRQRPPDPDAMPSGQNLGPVKISCDMQQMDQQPRASPQNSGGGLRPVTVHLLPQKPRKVAKHHGEPIAGAVNSHCFHCLTVEEIYDLQQQSTANA
jgi:hypothetical protein